MKRWWLLSAVLLLLACERPLPDGVTELVYATPYAPGHPFSLADRRWMEYVEQRSDGTLRIRANWSGGLLSSEHSMLELRHGVADIGLITPIYSRGGAHLIRVQSGFYSGVETPEGQVALYRCMQAASPQFARELEGLEVLAVQGGSLPGVITRTRAVRTLEDLRGLRLRVPNELVGVLRTLGADPVTMPMADVYSALAKGIIDGVVAPGDTFRSMHFAEVASHYTALAIPRGAYPARAIGGRRWAQLSEAHRRILRESVAVWEQALADEIRAALDSGLALAVEQGVTVHQVSADTQRRFDEAYLQEARRNAEALQRYGIDGLSVFTAARASVGPGGRVGCEEEG